ncbi:MAG: glycosyltransferase family 4 protein [Ruminococcus sp.]|nr:glycosyltransferase family 4 protein [Ruminococcus sp.]
MRIAFDALPLLGRKTGIGCCEAGQVTALARLYPEHDFVLNYFAMKDLKKHKQEISYYLTKNMTAKHAFCSAYGYRILSSFLPVNYDWFFGKNNSLTHFFNYIVPYGVSGKTVVTVHDMVYKAFPETVRSRTRHMLDLGLVKSMQRADRIVTDSEFSKSEIIKYYAEFEDKIRVVPCGVDGKKFYPVENKNFIKAVCQKYGIMQDYFLYLGTIEPRKNLERLIQAYALFVKSHENPAKLVLAGGKGWLYDNIFKKVTELNLEKYVIFTQYLEENDLCAVMSGALAFVFPSIYEGFGMPPLEAMACGTPVFTSGVASLPEVTGTNAVIVNPENIDSMAKGLHALFIDKNLRENLKIQGLARAKLFSWERSAKLLYQVYQEILPEVNA